MKIKSLITGSVLALLPLLSQANVVYEWKSINNEKPIGIDLRMEFDDNAFKQGSFVFDLSQQADPHGGPRPELGLISMRFAVGSESSLSYSREYGFYGDDNIYEVGLSINVSLGKRFMEGSIAAFDFSEYFSMVSENRKFTVVDYRTDNLGAGSCPIIWQGPCGGAAGFMMRVNDVPEPGSLALLGAGLFAASALRKKKPQQ